MFHARASVSRLVAVDGVGEADVTRVESRLCKLLGSPGGPGPVVKTVVCEV
jgi:hypothetical protein